MSNNLCHSLPARRSGRPCPPALRRFVASSLRRFPSAFTLIEMLVSLAVLSLAMAVVGVVFSVTTKTTSQAAAYSEANNWARQFTMQIKEDLRYCDPSKSVLVLVGRTQAAALTADDLQAGKFHRVLIGDQSAAPANYDPEYATGVPNVNYSNPRADLLMFFSQRPTVSVAPVPDAAPVTDWWAYPAAMGTKFTPVQVVYGHAALASPVWNAGQQQYEFPANPAALRHIEQVVGGGMNVNALSQTPANQWHLSRRATIVFDEGSWAMPRPDARWSVHLGAWYNDTTHGWLLPGDSVMFSVSTLLNHLGPLWGVGPGVPAALESPYGPVYGGFDIVLNNYIEPLLYSTWYNPPTLHHVATVLDEVPPTLQGNMAVHMLPGCAWFQVEFLMPEDPRNSVTYASPLPGAVGVSARADMPRWTSVQPGYTYFFVPDTQFNRGLIAQQVNPASGVAINRLAEFGRLDQDPTGDTNSPGTTVSNRIIRTWPYAIRVTVRVWDPRGRLDEPIVRSIVHRFD